MRWRTHLRRAALCGGLASGLVGFTMLRTDGVMLFAKDMGKAICDLAKQSAPTLQMYMDQNPNFDPNQRHPAGMSA